MSKLIEHLGAWIPAVGEWARRSWCRSQRRRLVAATTEVLWVPPDKVPWALWGAEHRFFHADWAGRLLYLRGR